MKGITLLDVLVYILVFILMGIGLYALFFV